MKVEINPQEQPHLFEPIPLDKLALLTKEELIILLKGERDISRQLTRHVQELEALNEELKQRSLLIQDEYVTIKNKLFGKSSERSSKRGSSGGSEFFRNKRKKVLLPSERYPNAPLIERHITLDKMPHCSCCGSEMQDSGLTEESQYLTKIPAQYYVVVQVRHKYACRNCHGDIKTSPVPPRIKEGSSYSDEMMIDVAVSKYCDLIPIERQAKMAAREGLMALPPQSLIDTTHYVADFYRPAYERLGLECLESKIFSADETPHRMLEGDKKCNWFLWGFSTPKASYFECHDTRSGDVASTLLIKSKCEFLVSDVYTGYAKAVKDANVVRLGKELPLIVNVYCNAHARRYFKQALENFEEAQFFINQYRKIYHLESLVKKNPLEVKIKIRARMKKYFEKMRSKIIEDIGGYSSKSAMGKAMGYLLKNYQGLTRFLEKIELPIDNNPQERLLRNPVIGRKTWYGTHSKRGAETAAILFSLVESCKLNRVNPREYFKNLAQDLHQGRPAYTPSEYRGLHPNQSIPST